LDGNDRARSHNSVGLKPTISTYLCDKIIAQNKIKIQELEDRVRELQRKINKRMMATRKQLVKILPKGFRQKHGRTMTQAELEQQLDFLDWCDEHESEFAYLSSKEEIRAMSREQKLALLETLLNTQRQAYIKAHGLHESFRLPMDDDY
jgi:hypothetical protein